MLLKIIESCEADISPNSLRIKANRTQSVFLLHKFFINADKGRRLFNYSYSWYVLVGTTATNVKA